MLGNYIRVGSLNARSMFKDSYKTKQREFASFLRAHSTGIDVLCLQEVSHFRSQTTLTEDQVRSFSFIFPHCSFVVSKHCAIVCLKPGLYLDSTSTILDERCVVASVMDSQHNVLCRVASIYAPAQSSDRPEFFDSFLTSPQWDDLASHPWFIVGDFNVNVHVPSEVRGDSISAWYEWLSVNFNNCHPEGVRTRPQSNNTIDYIFSHTALAPRVRNAKVEYVNSDWT
ncbi:endonuclease/exonuclease/phosphatase family protein, partial [Klebsiella pneumoniae]